MKKKPEQKLHNLIKQGDHDSIHAILTNTRLDVDLNQVDEKGCSPLYLAISLNYGIDQPEIVQMLLSRGAVIKNGVPGQPMKVPKLLTMYANAKNIQYIFNTLLSLQKGLQPKGLQPDDLLLEIGSGDGYLKYLLALCRNDEMSRVAGKIIETEPSSDLVRDNSSRGRYLLQSGVEGLNLFFRKNSLTAIISMNVLDLFPAGELIEKLELLHCLLKPGGHILHIMSSSVHTAVFQNIKHMYPEHILLPYYQEGYVGVRLVNSAYIQQGSGFVQPEQLSGLFARHPEKYMQIADEISRNFSGIKDQGRILLLKDFSLKQILKGLIQTGFKTMVCEEITSTSLVKPDQYHEMFPGYNQFSSIAGTLLTDVNKQIPSHQVLEKSVFFFIIASPVD